MSRFSYPKELAEAVTKNLAEERLGFSCEMLARLLEIAYSASLKKEEGQSILLALSCLDLNSPDPDPPELISATRWQVFRFDEPIKLDPSNLAKLAKSTDPRISTIAVWPGRGGYWLIWGIIDQADNWTKFLEGETEGTFEPPGEVDVVIEGPGMLSVRKGLTFGRCAPLWRFDRQVLGRVFTTGTRSGSGFELRR